MRAFTRICGILRRESSMTVVGQISDSAVMQASGFQ